MYVVRVLLFRQIQLLNNKNTGDLFKSIAHGVHTTFVNRYISEFV